MECEGVIGRFYLGLQSPGTIQTHVHPCSNETGQRNGRVFLLPNLNRDCDDRYERLTYNGGQASSPPWMEESDD